MMGFADIVGTVVNQVKSECSLDEVAAGFLPSMIFVWFFLVSLPAGVLSGRIGRKNTVLVSLAVTVAAMFLPLAGGALRPWPYFAAFALIGIGNTILQAALPALMGNVVPPALLASRIALGQFVKAVCAALTPVFIYVAASAMGNWRLVFPIYGVVAAATAAWLMLSRIPDEWETSDGLAVPRTTFGSCFALLRNPLILALTVGIFFAVGLDVGFSVAIPEFLKTVYKVDVNMAGTGPTVYFVGKTLATAAGAALFARFSPAKCFPWSMGLCILAVVAFFICSGPVAFLCCVFVASVASANTFVMCMGIALDKLPEKANEITSLMVMAIAGGAVVPPVLGFAQKCAGSTGLVWVLLACLVYQAVLSVSMYENAMEEK
ncbi:MAG: MFS transporter [Kiritimatiellae bacterium]|nr:MFS transporter [Kiritimatiellia bacterium]